MPVAAIAAYVFFGEVTDRWTWVGAAVIASSSIYVAHREAMLARRAARAVSPAAAPSAISRREVL